MAGKVTPAEVKAALAKLGVRPTAWYVALIVNAPTNKRTR